MKAVADHRLLRTPEAAGRGVNAMSAAQLAVGTVVCFDVAKP
jgi:hypothetical protein